MSDWIGAAEAAIILGVDRTSVYRSLRDPALRAAWWGERGVGWRYKPLSARNIQEVSRERAEYLAKHGGPAPVEEPGREDEQG